MDKQMTYQNAILTFLKDYAEVKPSDWKNVQNQVITDLKNHHYFTEELKKKVNLKNPTQVRQAPNKVLRLLLITWLLIQDHGLWSQEWLT